MARLVLTLAMLGVPFCPTLIGHEVRSTFVSEPARPVLLGLELLPL